MSKKLVAYFSASGVSKKVAQLLAEAAGADLYEIVPEAPYTAADLDWTNKQSRSTLEMQDLSCRPAIGKDFPDMAQYDTVYIGFPVWWGREPSVIDTFIDAVDMCGKTVVPFCTSGGNDVDGAVSRITELTAGKANVTSGKRIPADAAPADISSWLNN